MLTRFTTVSSDGFRVQPSKVQAAAMLVVRPIFDLIHLISKNVDVLQRQPLSQYGIQDSGRTAAPYPPTSLSGEGPEVGSPRFAKIEWGARF
ncbi:MAG TPA: hypothetical protein VI386_08050 [Candidatus Sulfotelmatobacter sp.]